MRVYSLPFVPEAKLNQLVLHSLALSCTLFSWAFIGPTLYPAYLPYVGQRESLRCTACSPLILQLKLPQVWLTVLMDIGPRCSAYRLTTSCCRGSNCAIAKNAIVTMVLFSRVWLSEECSGKATCELVISIHVARCFFQAVTVVSNLPLLQRWFFRK